MWRSDAGRWLKPHGLALDCAEACSFAAFGQEHQSKRSSQCARTGDGSRNLLYFIGKPGPGGPPRCGVALSVSMKAWGSIYLLDVRQLPGSLAEEALVGPVKSEQNLKLSAGAGRNPVRLGIPNLRGKLVSGGLVRIAYNQNATALGPCSQPGPTGAWAVRRRFGCLLCKATSSAQPIVLNPTILNDEAVKAFPRALPSPTLSRSRGICLDVRASTLSG
jgi:hypothetical protein